MHFLLCLLKRIAFSAVNGKNIFIYLSGFCKSIISLDKLKIIPLNYFFRNIKKNRKCRLFLRFVSYQQRTKNYYLNVMRGKECETAMRSNFTINFNNYSLPINFKFRKNKCN